MRGRKENISAVIITRNEEKNIGRCISSLEGIADEVVVVDSGSTDATTSVAESLGARVFFHEWTDYSSQKNYAETLTSNDWILSIDADEAISDELRTNILSLLEKGLDAGAVYSIRRLNNFCGKWIRHCGWYPDEKVRFWRKGVCQWEGSVHERLHYFSQVSKVLLRGDMLHYTCSDVGEYVQRQIRYGILGAEKAYGSGRRCGYLSCVFRPAWSFFRLYVLKGGFLDGGAGFMICRTASFSTLVKYYYLKRLNDTGG